MSKRALLWGVLVSAVLLAFTKDALATTTTCTITCKRCTMNLSTGIWNCEDCTLSCH